MISQANFGSLFFPSGFINPLVLPVRNKLAGFITGGASMEVTPLEFIHCIGCPVEIIDFESTDLLSVLK